VSEKLHHKISFSRVLFERQVRSLFHVDLSRVFSVCFPLVLLHCILSFSLFDSCSYLVLIRYWARLIDSGVPAMTTVLSLDPSSVLEILIVAPDSCLCRQRKIKAIRNECDSHRE